MAKTEDIILIGAGGHGKVVINAIQQSSQFNIYGITDQNLPKGVVVLGAKVLGTDEILSEIFKKGIKNAFISIGSVGDCNPRKHLYEKIKRIGFNFPAIVHPKAIVAQDVTIGEGTFAAAGAVVNPGTIIGKNVIVNTCSSIDHDCEIGDFVHVAPGANLCGGVKVGEGTHIGPGSKIVQGIDIGCNCMIKAGALVFQNISSGAVVHSDGSIDAAGESRSREI